MTLRARFARPGEFVTLDEELAHVPITCVDGANDRFAPPDHFSHL